MVRAHTPTAGHGTFLRWFLTENLDAVQVGLRARKREAEPPGCRLALPSIVKAVNPRRAKQRVLRTRNSMQTRQEVSDYEKA